MVRSCNTHTSNLEIHISWNMSKKILKFSDQKLEILRNPKILIRKNKVLERV